MNFGPHVARSPFAIPELLDWLAIEFPRWRRVINAQFRQISSSSDRYPGAGRIGKACTNNEIERSAEIDGRQPNYLWRMKSCTSSKAENNPRLGLIRCGENWI